MNINNVLAKAQRMMLDENWNANVERAAQAQRAKSINGRRSGGSSDLAAFEQMAFGRTSSAPERNVPLQSGPVQQRFPVKADGTPIEMIQEDNSLNFQNSKMPSNILESFMKTPPLSGDDYSSPIPDSYFNSLKLNTQPQALNEQAPVYQQSAAQGINYDLIKYIVKEAIKENAGTLNEGVQANLRGMRILEGNVIQLLDTKGNLYEGVLKLKKKASK